MKWEENEMRRNEKKMKWEDMMNEKKMRWVTEMKWGKCGWWETAEGKEDKTEVHTLLIWIRKDIYSKSHYRHAKRKIPLVRAILANLKKTHINAKFCYKCN